MSINKFYKISLLIIGICYFLFSNISFATTVASVEFFSSNNTAEIDIQTAYHRLTGKIENSCSEFRGFMPHMDWQPLRTRKVI